MAVVVESVLGESSPERHVWSLDAVTGERVVFGPNPDYVRRGRQPSYPQPLPEHVRRAERERERSRRPVRRGRPVRARGLRVSVWTSPSPSDFDRWRELVLDGQSPHDAAVRLGFRGSSAFRRADRERHGEVLNAWRAVRDAGKTSAAKEVPA